MDATTASKTYANELFEDCARVRASNGSAPLKMAIYGFFIREGKPHFASHCYWTEGDFSDVGVAIDGLKQECRSQSSWYEDCTGWVIVRVVAHKNGVLVSTVLESAAIVRTVNTE